jgi:ParB-like chromosome segregation protein Spo0J
MPILVSTLSIALRDGLRADTDIRALKADILKNGMQEPIVVVRWPHGVFQVKSGNLRLLALRSLGWTAAMVIVEE